MVLIDRNTLVRAPVVEQERATEELRRICETLRDRRWLRIAYKACEGLAGGRLEWRRAIELNDLWQSTIPSDRATVFPLLHRGMIELQLGMSAEADRTFAAAVEWARNNPGEAYEKAAVSQYLGRAMLMTSSTMWHDTAERFCCEALADRELPPLERLTAQSARGMLAVMRGDAAAAAASYEVILPVLGTLGTQRSDFAIGLIACTAGDRQAALRHFRDAAEFSPNPEDRQYAVWPRFFLADFLISRSRPGDREEAEDILKELVEIAARTESVLLGRRAGELRERLRGLPPAEQKVKRPGGLTDRELEILRAVASGRTNKEIGYRLCINRSTVNTHLENILTKIGAANRAEAASFAARNGLLG
jgi:DNA-binding CsgD family transcriptional regulator